MLQQQLLELATLRRNISWVTLGVTLGCAIMASIFVLFILLEFKNPWLSAIPAGVILFAVLVGLRLRGIWEIRYDAVCDSLELKLLDYQLLLVFRQISPELVERSGFRLSTHQDLPVEFMSYFQKEMR